MYPRILSEKIRERVGRSKVILLIGARQVGKTTLIETLLSDRKYLFLNGDDPQVRSLLANTT